MMSQLQTEGGATGSLRQREKIVACASLVSEGRKQIDRLAPSHAYPAAVELLQQGSPAQEVYFIDSGLVKLIRLEQDGRELIVALRFPGWLLGAASVIVQKPQPVRAVTVTNCYLRRIPAEAFLHLLRANAQLSWHSHQMQSREVFDQAARVAQLGCFSARHRLEQLLWQLISELESGEPHKEVRLQLPLKHWEVA